MIILFLALRNKLARSETRNLFKVDRKDLNAPQNHAVLQEEARSRHIARNNLLPAAGLASRVENDP